LPTPDLETQARRFGDDISDLLNRTIATGARLSAVLSPERGTCVVGRGVTRKNFKPQPIALTLGKKPPRAQLLVAYILQLDEEAEHLTVAKSGYSLYLDDDCEHMLMHYDYDRAPTNRYPDAHFQVNGSSAGFDRLVERAQQPPRVLKDFHLPVGGRRFRPTLEDIIEFLVFEELIEAASGWQYAIAEHREEWEDRQLGAAIRRRPQVAVAQLRALGHEVYPSSDTS
jgi:hypothetical protein